MELLNMYCFDHNFIIWATLNVQYKFFSSLLSSNLLCVQKDNGKGEVSNNHLHCSAVDGYEN